MVAITSCLKDEKRQRVAKKLHDRIIQDFLDLSVMALAQKQDVSGYDVIEHINHKFNFRVSSGTVYSLLYSLERNGLIVGKWISRKRVYAMTPKGMETMENILSCHDSAMQTFAQLFTV